MALFVLTATSLAAQPAKGTLKIAVPVFDAEVFDPIKSSGVSAQHYMLYLPLIGVNHDSTQLSTKTGIADAWQGSADNKTWTVHIRDGITWWDGMPITAHDVKFSLPRLWQKGSRVGRTKDVKKLLDPVEKTVEIVDDQTIRFHLNKPLFWFPTYLGMSTYGMVVPKHFVEKHGEEALARGEMGSGPYRLVEHVSGNVIRFAAVPNHPTMKPRYQFVEYYQVPEESTRLAQLRTGQLHMAQFTLDRIPELQQAGAAIMQKPSGTLLSLLFVEPYKDPVLAKKEVRTQVFYPDNLLKYNPIEYDLAQARKIVEREVPKDYVLTVHGMVRGPITSTIIEAYAGMLGKAGFKTRIKTTDYSSLRSRWRKGQLGPGLFLKNGRRLSVYIPSIYAASPKQDGRHHLVDANNPSVQVHPAISPADLQTLDASDAAIRRLLDAKSWDEYWSIFKTIMDKHIANIAPGSGWFFVPTIMAIGKGAPVPEWEINGGARSGWYLPNVAVYPPH
jgi:ABC-type transport system substrate-binding protein